MEAGASYSIPYRSIGPAHCPNSNRGCQIRNALLFIIYINNFAKASQKFNFIMYADDTTLSNTIDSFSTYEQHGNVEFVINTTLNKISEWLKLNKLSLNLNKTKYMLFKTARRKSETFPLLIIDNTTIDRVAEFRFLEINLNEQFNWKSHIDNISNIFSRTLGVLNRLKPLLPSNI